MLFGDTWDLTYGYDHPYLLVGGLQPNGVCPVRTYHQFRIGDGEGSDVTGSVFVDQNHNAQRDGSEVGFAGQQVRLDTNSVDVALASNLSSSGGTLTKIGAGTLTVSGANNTYDGGTSINGGILALGSASALGSTGTDRKSVV